MTNEEIEAVGNAIVAAARSRLGIPYNYGSKWTLADENPRGPIDCSGLTIWAYYQGSKGKLILPHGSHAQFGVSLECRSPRVARPGDLGFFRKAGASCHHVGILANETEVIEARGEPYNQVIIRPRSKWEAWHEFTGWMRPQILIDMEAE